MIRGSSTFGIVGMDDAVEHAVDLAFVDHGTVTSADLAGVLYERLSTQ